MLRQDFDEGVLSAKVNELAFAGMKPWTFAEKLRSAETKSAPSPADQKWHAAFGMLRHRVLRGEAKMIRSEGGAYSGMVRHIGLSTKNREHLVTWLTDPAEQLDFTETVMREGQYAEYDGPMPKRTSRLPVYDASKEFKGKRNAAAFAEAAKGGPEAVKEFKTHMEEQSR